MTLSARRPSKVKEQLMDDVRGANEPKKRLNAEVEASLYRRIKARAVTEDRTISDITRQLWVEYLSNNSNE
jgi:hypothetical protein